MGFIKLPDNLDEWAWFGDNITLAVYIRLRLAAKYKPADVGNVHLERGQLVTSIREVAEKNGISIRQARTALERLEKTHKIAIKSTAKNSVVTLIDYDCESDSDTQNDTLMTSRRHTERQANDTPTTNCRQTDDTASLLKTNSRLSEEQRGRENTPARETSDKPQKPKKSAPEKKRYAEYVTLTEEEYAKLVEQHGEEAVKWFIQKLDNYKGSSGKKYESDYRAILSWVISSYKEEQAKHKQPPAQNRPPNGYNQSQSGNPFLDMLRDLEEKEANEIDIQGNVTDNGST
ncbi:MAG: hypothetical protein NC299_10670 [Lachnospiraceae bacterium]|nr:hypothetical protein [Ruminococcus sp.]MCM1275811.1 hypothetical protein [Lachnospiraceae bacterium]